MAAANNRIVLVGSDDHYIKGTVGAAFSPGMAVELQADGNYDPMTSAIGAALRQPLIVAVEDALQGLTIDDALTVGEEAQLYVPQVGNVINCLVKDGQVIAIGDLLVVEGGTSGLFIEAPLDGTVTQITSSTTGVTLNSFNGTITTEPGTLAAGAEESFVVTNSRVAAGDVVAVALKSYGGGGTPSVEVSAVAAGSFTIRVTNLHASAALDALMVINFSVVGKADRCCMKALEALSPSGANGFVACMKI